MQSEMNQWKITFRTVEANFGKNAHLVVSLRIAQI